MTGGDSLEVNYNQEDFVGNVETNGMTANLFQTDSIYEDDNYVTQNA